MNTNRKLIIATTISIALIIITSVVAACGACSPGGGGFSTIEVVITFIAGLSGGVLGVLIANKIDKK